MIQLLTSPNGNLMGHSCWHVHSGMQVRRGFGGRRVGIPTIWAPDRVLGGVYVVASGLFLQLVRVWSDNEHFTWVTSVGGRIWIDRFRDFA